MIPLEVCSPFSGPLGLLGSRGWLDVFVLFTQNQR